MNAAPMKKASGENGPCRSVAVHQQPPTPRYDRHIYASRTRFIPDDLLSLVEKMAWPVVEPQAVQPAVQAIRVDVRARLLGMWR